MKDFMTPFKVGLLVIAGVFATLFMLTRLTSDGAGSEGEDFIRVYAMFSDVTGLAERSRIRMAGIPVGEIASIELDGTQARVELLVRRDLNLRRGVAPATEGGTWKNGATISRRTASVIGDYFLEVTPGTEGPPINEGERVYNVNEGASLEQIFANLERITADIQSVTESLSAVLGGEEGQKGLEQILRDLQTILREMSQFVVTGTDKLDGILTDGKAISSNVRELAVNSNQSFEEILFESKVVVRDAKAIVRNVRDIVGQSSGDVQAGLGSLSGTLIRLQSTLDSLNYSLQNVQDITDKVNEGEGTIGALVNDPGIAEKADAILADTQDVTDTIGRLKTILELRSEYHPLHNRFKNVVGLRLQPRANKYYLVEFVDDFRFDSAYELQTVLDDEGNPIDQNVIRTTTDSFRFTVQYALGWNFWENASVYGRFGIIESTGGIGGTFDYGFSGGQLLRVHADLFDFDIEGVYNPRVRLMTELHLADHLRIIAGLDDMFNEPPELGADKTTLDQGFNGLSPFLSIGFIFTDEDLKGLLTISGVPSAQ